MQITNTMIHRYLLSRSGNWICQWSRFHHCKFIPCISQKTTHKKLRAKSITRNRSPVHTYVQRFTARRILSMRPGLLLQKINCRAQSSDNPRFEPRSGGPLMFPHLLSYMITALKMTTTTISRHTARHSRRVLSFSLYTIPCAVHKQPLNQTERMWTHRWADKNNLMHFTSQGTHILVTVFRRRQHGTFKTKLL
jgi:hypothetical protein